MGVRIGVLAMLMCGCDGQPAGTPEFTISLTPAAFSPTVTELTVVVHATDEAGQVGKGEVTLVPSVGTIAPDRLTLDAYGSARAVWTCLAQCDSGGRVDGTWPNPGSAAGLVRAEKTAPFVGQAGSGGGGGSSSGGPFTSTVETGSSWRLSTVAPSGTGWTTLSFDDSSWPNALLIVPKGMTAGQLADSIWDQGPTVSSGSLEIWARRTFTIPGTSIESAVLDIACNDDMEVWINGANVITDRDGASTVRLGVSVAPSVVAGQNVIAANCRDVVLPEHAIWGRLVVKSR